MEENLIKGFQETFSWKMNNIRNLYEIYTRLTSKCAKNNCKEDYQDTEKLWKVLDSLIQDAINEVETFKGMIKMFSDECIELVEHLDSLESGIQELHRNISEQRKMFLSVLEKLKNLALDTEGLDLDDPFIAGFINYNL